MVEALERGRRAYDARDWPACVAALSLAETESPLRESLEGDDLRRLGIAQFLAGDRDGSLQTLARGHRAAIEREDWTAAAETAFWHAWMLYLGAEHARAAGWLARARTIIEEHDVEESVAMLPATLEARHLVETGHLEEALELAGTAVAAGRRLGAPDLHVMGLLAASMALIRLGRGAEALPRLDEVMATVEADELTPTVAGLAYCAVLAACLSLHDVRRAAEWTTALATWCEHQSGLVPYRGQCLVHRTQVLTLEGAWPDADAQGRLACAHLVGPPQGDAWYHVGELHRLRGDYASAEGAYRKANTAGRQPEPGLALMRLAQGRLDAAAAATRRLVAEEGRLDRPDVLTAHVEVMVAAGDLEAGRRAADELAELATALDSPVLAGHAAASKGIVTLAAGAPAEALTCLRTALASFASLAMPYHVARVRARLGEALDQLGDAEAAALEREAARDAFEALGAAADAAALGPAASDSAALPDGLTAREVEVIRLVATGLSNRAVAESLVLSEKTVARHLANVYTKLGLSSRTAATAYAYDHGLLG
ncbi:LuxR C-terminal-related transcriptional regulator [Nocardioides sp. AN3]